MSCLFKKEQGSRGGTLTHIDEKDWQGKAKSPRLDPALPPATPSRFFTGELFGTDM